MIIKKIYIYLIFIVRWLVVYVLGVLIIFFLGVIIVM